MKLCVALFLLCVSARADDGFQWAISDTPAFEWRITTGSGGGRPSIPTAPESSDNRPVLEMLIPPGDWCDYCNWWKARGDADLPVRIKPVVVNQQPRYGYPTFRIPHGKDGREWFIANPGNGATAPASLVKAWRRLSGDSTDQVATAAAIEDSTPHSQVAIGLELLDPQPGERLADLGCDDGRVLIAAAETYGIEAAGVEIDPQRALKARARVDSAGLSDLVEVIEGDATQINVDADIGYVYLYPQTLAELAPKLRKMRRVVSYLHAIPGMQGRKQGKFWVYERRDPVPQVLRTEQAQPPVVMQGRPYAIYQGMKFYGPCCNDWSCGMRAEIMRQLATQQHVEQIAIQLPRAACGLSGCSGQGCFWSGCAGRGCAGCSRDD